MNDTTTTLERPTTAGSDNPSLQGEEVAEITAQVADTSNPETAPMSESAPVCQPEKEGDKILPVRRPEKEAERRLNNDARSPIPMSATDEANATTESAPVVQWIADDEYERDVERLNQQPDQPWPEPVDGALLLRQTFAIIQTYTSIPEAAADLVALFPPASFALYRCKYEYAPRLMIVGEPDSGKSTLMKILAGMCQRPFISTDLTKAPLFEAIDAQKPTIIIDEAQRNLAEHKDLLTLLHAGYDWNSAITRRKRGSYNTFALAIMAGVGDYGSLELKSRAFIIEMITALEALPHKFVPRFVAPELEEIRRKWLRWTIDNRAPIMDCQPELPLALSRNRLGDVAGILLRIPDVCGGEWPERG